MQERLEKIEIRCSYLEKMVDDLNTVVIEQQQEIRELRRLVAILGTKVTAMAALPLDPDEKPPHY